MRSVRVAVACTLLVAGACGGDDAPSDPTPERVTGLVIEIDPPEGGPVERFSVEEDDGDVYELAIDPELDYGFDLNHLYEHLEAEDPVAVLVDASADELIARSIEDV